MPKKKKTIKDCCPRIRAAVPPTRSPGSAHVVVCQGRCQHDQCQD